MKIAKISAPLAIAGCLALTGCNFGTDASSDNKTSGGSTQSAAPTSGETKPSEETKSESPTSESSSESSSSSSSESPSSSESSTSSSSSSSSSSTRPSYNLSNAELAKYASANELRACNIFNLQHGTGTGQVQFCGTNDTDIKADYKGQPIYFTQATGYTKGATYSIEVEKDGRKESKTFDDLDPTGQATNGMPLTLSAPLNVNSAGDYKVTFKKNGSDIKSRTFHLTLD